MPTKRICDLFGDEEAVHRGRRPLRDEPPPRAAEDPDRAGRGRDGRDQGDVVQPAVARGEARRRHARADPRPCEPARLRRLVVRPRRRGGDGRLRSRLSRHRGRRAEEAARPPRAGARPRPRRRRRAARRAARMPSGCRLRADALSVVHRPRSLPEAEVGRTRLAFDELLVLRLALLRTAAARESASAQPLGEPGELIARYRASLPFTLTADQERAMAEIDADLDRADPDAAPPPGRRRVGQDRRRAARAAPRGRGWAPGRADGADRDARRAALPHDRRAVRAARRPRGAADELAAREGARGGPAADRVGRRAGRRRNARAHREGGRLRRSRRRRRRRAAPLRGRAAHRARRGAEPARPPPHRDADPANARAHRLRRPRGERARAASGRPQAGDHGLGDRRPQLRGVLAALCGTSTTGGRPTSCARSSRRPRRASRAPPRRRPSGSARPSSAATASAASTGGCRPAERRERHGAASRRASWTSSSRRR